MTTAPQSDVPRGVTVRWADSLGVEGYRAPAPKRPLFISVRPARKGLFAASSAGVGGLASGGLLLEYGVTHVRGLASLAGVSLAVIAGVLLDRIAPRLLNRTEIRFTDDALEVRVRPLGDARATRIAYDDISAFEVEVIVDPMSRPPVLVHQINARRSDGTVEPVASVDDADTAAWLRHALIAHAVR